MSYLKICKKNFICCFCNTFEKSSDLFFLVFTSYTQLKYEKKKTYIRVVYNMFLCWTLPAKNCVVREKRIKKKNIQRYIHVKISLIADLKIMSWHMGWKSVFYLHPDQMKGTLQNSHHFWAEDEQQFFVRTLHA